MTPFNNLLKIVMVGDSAVGKSCLLTRFVDDSFTQIYSSTIGVDFKIKTIDVDGTAIKLQIWDTAGQERFKVIVNGYYRGAHIVFLVFDLNSRLSFMNIPKWYDEVKKLTCDGTKMLLIGCKSELKWEVSEKEIQSTSDRYGIPWYICSAFKGNGVERIYQIAARECIDSLKKRETVVSSTQFKIKIKEAQLERSPGCCNIL